MCDCKSQFMLAINYTTKSMFKAQDVARGKHLNDARSSAIYRKCKPICAIKFAIPICLFIMQLLCELDDDKNS